MGKRTSTIIGVIVVLALIVGGYAIFHKSNNYGSKGNATASTSNATPVNNSVITTKTTSAGRQYLADPSGKPLYTYNADSSGVSNCTGSCLSNWPGYYATSSAANLPANVSTIKRSDNGRLQYTYNGMPLYYFTSDSAGNPTGDGVENFSLAEPAGSSSSTSTPAPASQQSTPPASNSNPYNY